MEEIVDTNAWPTMQVEQEGQDARKAWLAEEPTAEHDRWWLWKPSLITPWRDERRLTHVAEVVTSRLAGAIGLPVADCRLATRAGEIGVLSRNFCPRPLTLIHGAALLPENGLQRLNDIERALEDVAAPPTSEPLRAFDVFAGYLVLDAWVANTDRHERNWAVLEDADGIQTLAPSFDHGTALGSGMSDAARAKRSVRDFCARGRASRYDGPVTLLDLADDAAARCPPTPWAARVAALPPRTWQVILDDIGN